MTYPLAIFAPTIGIRSETFIRRHMEDLLPGRTVVVARTTSDPHAINWIVNCPTLLLDQTFQPRLRQQFFRAISEKFGRKYDDPSVIAIKKFLIAHNVTVVLGEYLDQSLPWLEVCRQLGIRFWGHAHGYDVSQNLRVEKWRKAYQSYNEANGIITINEISRQRLLDLGLQCDKVHVVHYGVPVAETLCQHAATDVIHCLAVGRMVAKKAPILTLNAFRIAAEKHPQLRLDYIGQGPLLSAVRDFIQVMNPQGKVTLHGGQPNEVVQQMMANTDIFLQHSLTDPETGDEEGLPVAILEAMAAGLPVVSTRHAGIPEAVIDSITGFLVNEGDSQGMAERISELANNSDLRQKMGSAGWQRAKKDFSVAREQAALRNILGLAN